MALKYYPLRPSIFVVPQYLWTYDDGIFRRALLSTVASFFHQFDPERILPVIEFVSSVELGIGLLVLCIFSRAAGQTGIRTAGYSLFLFSGFIPHILYARGNQDPLCAVLILLGFTCVLHRRVALGILCGVVSVLVHEASAFYFAAGLAVIHLSTSAPHEASLSGIARWLISSTGRWFWGSLFAIAIAAAVPMFLTHVDPSFVQERCTQFEFLRTYPFTEMTRHFSPRQIGYQPWEANCGLQFRTFVPSLSFWIRSFGVGLFSAPVVIMLLIVLLARRDLSWLLRALVLGAVLSPTVILILAYDVSRFWSYLNGIALLAIILLDRRSSNEDRASVAQQRPRYFVGALAGLVGVWTVIFIVIHQSPNGWERQQSPLPGDIAAQFPRFRDALCLGSRSGLCYAPTVQTIFK